MAGHMAGQPVSAAPETDVLVIRTHEATVRVAGVRVRWRAARGPRLHAIRWLCDECGSHPNPTCWHAAHAAAAVATQLLGLPAEVITTNPKEQN